MDEAERVIERLERIRELDRAAAPAGALLEELRMLVGEAEAWARVEGDARAAAAVSGVEASVARLESEAVVPSRG